MDSKPLVSIIILNYKFWKMTQQCVEKLLEETKYPNFEVIILDNGSKNGSFEHLTEVFNSNRNIKTIKSETNLGYSGGSNYALKFASGEYIALLSNDVIVTKNWLSNLVNAINENSEVFAVQSKMLLFHHPDRIDSLGHIVDPVGFLRAESYMELASDFGLHRKRVCVLQLVSCLIPMSTIRRVGLFDSDYFIIHEDTDISMRIGLAKGLVLMIPSSIVYHIRSQTISKMEMRKVVYLNRRNILLTIIKNYSKKSLLVYIPIHLFASLLLASWYLFGRRKVHWFTACLLGIIWNLKNLRKTLAKRSFVQKKIRKTSDAFLFSSMEPFNIFNILSRRNTSPVVYEHITEDNSE